MQASAVGLYHGLPISDPASLQDVTIEVGEPQGREILVAVMATAVNPIDTKQRQGQAIVTEPRILGFDAVGKVLAVGETVTTIMPDDIVYYAGAVNRPGSDAQYQLVDERLVAQAPKSWTPAQSAGLPLTTLTAWEALFEKLPYIAAPQANQGHSVLIINIKTDGHRLASQQAIFNLGDGNPMDRRLFGEFRHIGARPQRLRCGGASNDGAI